MPTIVFSSPKGGSSKTTSALILATELAGQGATATVIDADPNRPIVRWSKRAMKPPKGIRVVEGVTENTIIDVIDRSARETAFVIVDLEGTASQMAPYAVGRADLVLIPTQGSMLDALEAVKAVKMIQAAEKLVRHTIPAAILVTRTSPAIQPRTLKYVQKQFEDAGVKVLPTHIHERDAYKAMFIFGGALSSLDPAEVRNVDTAVANARAYTREVLKMLKANERAAA
jgi:chromosome partitioning protein